MSARGTWRSDRKHQGARVGFADKFAAMPARYAPKIDPCQTDRRADSLALQSKTRITEFLADSATGGSSSLAIRQAEPKPPALPKHRQPATVVRVRVTGAELTHNQAAG